MTNGSALCVDALMSVWCFTATIPQMWACTKLDHRTTLHPLQGLQEIALLWKTCGWDSDIKVRKAGVRVTLRQSRTDPI
jgi:hypothetical protein